MRIAAALLAAFAVGCGGEESSAPVVDASDEPSGEQDATIDADSIETLARDTWVCSQPDNGISADADDAKDGQVFACGPITCTADQACVTHRSEGDAWCSPWSYANCIPLGSACDAGASCACVMPTSPCGPDGVGACLVDSVGHVRVMCLF